MGKIIMHNKIIGSIELPILPPPAGSIFLGLSAGRIASLVREGLDEAYAAFFKELGGELLLIMLL